MQILETRTLEPHPNRLNVGKKAHRDVFPTQHVGQTHLWVPAVQPAAGRELTVLFRARSQGELPECTVFHLVCKSKAISMRQTLEHVFKTSESQCHFTQSRNRNGAGVLGRPHWRNYRKARIRSLERHFTQLEAMTKGVKKVGPQVWLLSRIG